MVAKRRAVIAIANCKRFGDEADLAFGCRTLHALRRDPNGLPKELLVDRLSVRLVFGKKLLPIHPLFLLQLLFREWLLRCHVLAGASIVLCRSHLELLM